MKNKKQRKYNNQTGCYKIDVFLNGRYLWSTDQHKTCKSAKTRAIELNLGINPKQITAFFYYL